MASTDLWTAEPGFDPYQCQVSSASTPKHTHNSAVKRAKYSGRCLTRHIAFRQLTHERVPNRWLYPRSCTRLRRTWPPSSTSEDATSPNPVFESFESVDSSASSASLASYGACTAVGPVCVAFSCPMLSWPMVLTPPRGRSVGVLSVQVTASLSRRLQIHDCERSASQDSVTVPVRYVRLFDRTGLRSPSDRLKNRDIPCRR